MSTDIYLLGVGGHGQVVLDTLLESGVKVTGIFDPRLRLGEEIFGIPVLEENAYLSAVAIEGIRLVNGLGANPQVINRKKLFITMKKRGFSFVTLKHPSALVGKECNFGEGSQLMAGSILQSRITLGHNVVINTGASIDHDCTLGMHTFVSPRSILCGSVSIGESSFVGAGAIVMPGIEVGEKVIIGAGAVVTKDVPNGWIMAKNPAVKIGMNI